LPLAARQDRRRQEIALAQHLAETRQGWVGPQIGALDVDVRDAAVAGGDDLVARADDVLARAHLDLPRPGKVWQQLGDIDSAAGEGAERVREGGDRLLAHRVEPDSARRDRRRVAVLEP